jgi:HSP20 family protein
MLPILRNFEPISRGPQWNNLGRLLDELWSGDLTTHKIGNIDVYEDDNKLYIDAELPGFKREEIAITLEDNVLLLEAQRGEEKEHQSNNYFVRERTQGKIARAIRLPVAVDEGKVEASFGDGVLKVSLEKHQKSKAHKIQIKQ